MISLFSADKQHLLTVSHIAFSLCPHGKRQISGFSFCSYKDTSSIGSGPHFYDLIQFNSAAVMSDSLRPCRLQPARLLCPQDFPGKNTGKDYHALLQGIFQTQGPNLCLLVSCIGRQVLYHQHHRGSPHLTLITSLQTSLPNLITLTVKASIYEF